MLVGDFFTEGARLYEVMQVRRGVALVQDASATLEAPPDLLHVEIDDLLDGGKWRRVVPVDPDPTDDSEWAKLLRAKKKLRAARPKPKTTTNATTKEASSG